MGKKRERARTNVDEPRVDGSETELVLLVSFGDFWVGIDHPTQLDG